MSTQEELSIIKDVAATAAILTDPVYTGKALCGLVDLMKRNPPVLGGDVLFLHTGGTFGLFETDTLRALQSLMPAGQVQRMVVPSAL